MLVFINLCKVIVNFLITGIKILICLLKNSNFTLLQIENLIGNVIADKDVFLILLRAMTVKESIDVHNIKQKDILYVGKTYVICAVKNIKKNITRYDIELEIINKDEKNKNNRIIKLEKYNSIGMTNTLLNSNTKICKINSRYFDFVIA